MWFDFKQQPAFSHFDKPSYVTPPPVKGGGDAGGSPSSTAICTKSVLDVYVIHANNKQCR
jgi:hypothetical protein